jgi:LPXTG-motif cell wall-anchored protein
MPNGDVTIKAVLEEVKEDVKEEVKEEVKNPQTGDNIVAYTALLAIAVVGIVATVIVKKK